MFTLAVLPSWAGQTLCLFIQASLCAICSLRGRTSSPAPSQLGSGSQLGRSEHLEMHCGAVQAGSSSWRDTSRTLRRRWCWCRTQVDIPCRWHCHWGSACQLGRSARQGWGPADLQGSSSHPNTNPLQPSFLPTNKTNTLFRVMSCEFKAVLLKGRSVVGKHVTHTINVLESVPTLRYRPVSGQ